MPFEIFFYDLNEEIQKKLLAYMEVAAPEELNWDVFPIAEVNACEWSD